MRSAALLAVVLLVIVPSSEAGQRHKWWQSGDIKSELRISDEQSESIEQIYQKAQPTLRSLMRGLNSEEKVLSVMIDAADGTESDVAQQIDKVETARGALGKERLLMIYRMHRELSADQRAGLREWMRESRRSRSSTRER
jgi:Spy/CpxP family protein refolding chaperone